MHEGMSLFPKNPHEKAGHGDTHLKSQHWEHEDKRTPGACWPASE